MVTSAITGTSSSLMDAAATNSQSAAAAAAASSAPTESMFLQLLVAQIKNQDPTNPTDGIQFVAQLAQFSQLEQTLAIRKDADTISSALTPATTKTGSTN
jgi:flagellar basal-body rod modification protein FlgD